MSLNQEDNVEFVFILFIVQTKTEPPGLIGADRFDKEKENWTLKRVERVKYVFFIWKNGWELGRGFERKKWCIRKRFSWPTIISILGYWVQIVAFVVYARVFILHFSSFFLHSRALSGFLSPWFSFSRTLRHLAIRKQTGFSECDNFSLWLS